MKSINTLLKIVAILLTLSFAQISHATKCGQFIYNKYGMLRKYNWIPNTPSENTKKHGITSSTIKPSTEHTTASVDPGVSTGATTAGTQYWSSWGACSFLNVMKGADYRQKYLQENFEDIKKQVAIGNGGHIESLAAMNSCPHSVAQRLGFVLQNNYEQISGFSETRASELTLHIEKLIHSDQVLNQACATDKI